MARHKIAVIPGDGIGKEVVPEGLRVLDAAATRFGFKLETADYDWSCERYKKLGDIVLQLMREAAELAETSDYRS